jgi:hypothetical protein
MQFKLKLFDVRKGELFNLKITVDFIKCKPEKKARYKVHTAEARGKNENCRKSFLKQCEKTG